MYIVWNLGATPELHTQFGVFYAEVAEDCGPLYPADDGSLLFEQRGEPTTLWRVMRQPEERDGVLPDPVEVVCGSCRTVDTAKYAAVQALQAITTF